MKKLFLVLLFSVIVGCTANQRAKSMGGSSKISLPKGRQFINITWKENNLWVLSKKIEGEYKPQVYVFQEYSNWGLVEGNVIIEEN